MAHLIENAGGVATTGGQRILELVPTKIHERTPIYLGSARDVDMIVGFLHEEGGMAV